MFYTFLNVYCITQFFLKCFNKTTTEEDVIYTSGLFIMVLTDLEQEPNQNFQEQFHCLRILYTRTSLVA